MLARQKRYHIYKALLRGARANELIDLCMISWLGCLIDVYVQNDTTVIDVVSNWSLECMNWCEYL